MRYRSRFEQDAATRVRPGTARAFLWIRLTVAVTALLVNIILVVRVLEAGETLLLGSRGATGATEVRGWEFGTTAFLFAWLPWMFIAALATQLDGARLRHRPPSPRARRFRARPMLVSPAMGVITRGWSVPARIVDLLGAVPLLFGAISVVTAAGYPDHFWFRRWAWATVAGALLVFVAQVAVDVAMRRAR